MQQKNASPARTAIIFGSVTRTGNTFVAAEKIAKLLVDADLYHADDIDDPGVLGAYAKLVFLTPTAGNEEVAEPFERLFDRERIDLSHAEYAVCELGNYYGYDLYEYGAAKILHRLIGDRGGRKFHPTLSLDTLPLIDWELFDGWAESLRLRIAKHD